MLVKCYQSPKGSFFPTRYTKPNRNFDLLVSTDGFSKYQPHTVYLLQVSEEIVWEAAMGWIEHDLNQREHFFENFFSLISLGNLSDNYLLDILVQLVKDLTLNVYMLVLPSFVCVVERKL